MSNSPAPVTWIKRKYTQRKSVSMNRSHHNDNRPPRHKTPDPRTPKYVWGNHVKVLCADQKIRWRHS